MTGQVLHIGVAGWSYPDWRETVYRLPAPPQPTPDLFGVVSRPACRYVSDELAFIAQYVDMVEINSTFYRIPSPRTTAAWAKSVRAHPEFFFTAKLNRQFTHEFRQDQAGAATFRAALQPLQETGLLRGILAQFRYDFVDCPKNRGILNWICDQFAQTAPLIAEVRHVSWDAESAYAFLRARNLAVATLDYPAARDSFNPYVCTIGPYAYLRLHGRNRQAWYSSTSSVSEIYNYDYSSVEIRELAARAKALLKDVKELTIVANNHYQGKALSAALRLKVELTGADLPVPPALLETYPDLKRIRDTKA